MYSYNRNIQRKHKLKQQKDAFLCTSVFDKNEFKLAKTTMLEDGRNLWSFFSNFLPHFVSKLWRNRQIWITDSCLAAHDTSEMTIRTRGMKRCRTLLFFLNDTRVISNHNTCYTRYIIVYRCRPTQYWRTIYFLQARSIFSIGWDAPVLPCIRRKIRRGLRTSPLMIPWTRFQLEIADDRIPHAM